MHKWHSKAVWAADKGYWHLVLEYLDGEDVEKLGPGGWTVLSVCAAKGHLEMLRHVVEVRGANLETRDDCGRTALVWAAANGQREAVEYLITRGSLFGVDGADDRKRTACAWAAQNGFVEIVCLLASRRADLLAKDAGGETPLSLAVSRHRWPVVAMLDTHGVEIPSELRDRVTEFKSSTETCQQRTSTGCGRRLIHQAVDAQALSSGTCIGTFLAEPQASQSSASVDVAQMWDEGCHHGRTAAPCKEGTVQSEMSSTRSPQRGWNEHSSWGGGSWQSTWWADGRWTWSD